MPIIILCLIAIIAVIAIVLLKFRAEIYDRIITSMTSAWYRSVLERVPDNARILDVGIGTGAALLANKDLIEKKNLTIVGVDYDLDYVKRCKELIHYHLISDRLSVYHASIYDFMTPGSTTMDIEKFDVIYFSGSLMIMPSPVAALVHTLGLLKSPTTGSIFTTQTFEKNKNILLEKVKPLLKFITTIDFGNVTYEKDFMDTVNAANLKVKTSEEILPSSALSTSVAKNSRRFRLYELVKK